MGDYYCDGGMNICESILGVNDWKSVGTPVGV